jgi:hypothetical protein
VSKLKAKDVARIKPKSTCCKKDTRCLKCPVVVHRLCKQDCTSMGKQHFKKALKKARRR